MASWSPKRTPGEAFGLFKNGSNVGSVFYYFVDDVGVQNGPPKIDQKELRRVDYILFFC